MRWVALLAVLAVARSAPSADRSSAGCPRYRPTTTPTSSPASAESTAVNAFVQKTTDTQTLPYLVVVEKTTGLTAADLQAVQGFVASIPSLTSPRTPHAPSASSSRRRRRR